MAWPNDANSLITAASRTDLNRVREILAAGVDPTAPSEFRRTALPNAARYAYNNEANAILIVDALLDAGADINASTGDQLAPLRHAAIHGYRDLVRHLLSRGADPNDTDPVGQTIITMIETTPSLRSGKKRIIKMLEEAGGLRSVPNHGSQSRS